MKFLNRFIGAIGMAILYGCLATCLVEGIGLVNLWQSGALSRDKLRQYAAVIYGFDLPSLLAKPSSSESDDQSRERSRVELVKARAHQNPTLSLRQAAIKQGSDDIRSHIHNVSTKRERYEFVKAGFDELLSQLERDVNTSALGEVRRTLEVLQPRQTKDLMIGMLQTGDITPEDDVLEDVLAMISGMPQDKLKKIFREFKSEQERIVLHRILVAMGAIEDS